MKVASQLKEISSQQIKILSRRALDFLNSPKHLDKKSLEGINSIHPKWVLTFEEHSENGPSIDNILTIFYSYPKALEVEMLFFETLSRFTVGKNILFLNKLTFRELENYLRDENHLPVFENFVLNELEEMYKTVKNSLLTALLLFKIKNNTTFQSLQISWKELSLVEKNLTFKMLFFDLNFMFSPTRKLELVLVENDEVYINMNDFPLSAEVILELADELFKISTAKTSLKVVAV